MYRWMWGKLQLNSWGNVWKFASQLSTVTHLSLRFKHNWELKKKCTDPEQEATQGCLSSFLFPSFSFFGLSRLHFSLRVSLPLSFLSQPPKGPISFSKSNCGHRTNVIAVPVLSYGGTLTIWPICTWPTSLPSPSLLSHQLSVSSFFLFTFLSFTRKHLHFFLFCCICWFSRLPRLRLSHHPWPLLAIIFSGMPSCYRRTTEPCFGHPAVLTHKTVKVKCLVKDLPARSPCMLCKALPSPVQVTLSPKKRATLLFIWRLFCSLWVLAAQFFIDKDQNAFLWLLNAVFFFFFVALYWCPSSKRHITALKFWLPSFLLCIFVILGDFLPGARLLREWLSEFTSPTSPHLKKPRGVTHACVGFLLETHEDVRVKMLMSTQSNICKFKGLDANRGELKRSVVLAGQGVNPPIVWKSKQLTQWLTFHQPAIALEKYDGHDKFGYLNQINYAWQR